MCIKALVSCLAVLFLTPLFAACHPTDRARNGVRFSLGKDTTALTAPLRSDGCPDYVAAFNARYRKGMKPEDNAFVALISSVIDLKTLPQENRIRMLQMAGCSPDLLPKLEWQRYAEFAKQSGVSGPFAWEEQVDAAGGLWNEERHPIYARYLDRQAAALDAVREVSAKRAYWMPYVPENGRTLDSVEDPVTPELLYLLYSLLGRATLRAGNGDIDGALVDMMAVKRVGLLVGSGGWVTEKGFMFATDSLVNQSLGILAGSGKLTVKQCVQLERQLADIESRNDVAEVLDVLMRWIVLDSAVALATNNKQAAELTYRERGMWNELDVNQVDWNLVLRKINSCVDEQLRAISPRNIRAMREAVEKVARRRDENVAAFTGGLGRRSDESNVDYSQRAADAIILSKMSIVGKLEESQRSMNMENQMLRALVAAAHYRAEIGVWPGQLKEIVPKYLKAVPKNIWSQEESEIQFERSKNGARVIAERNVQSPSSAVKIGMKWN